MKQTQLTEGRLLNAFGNLNECGYATSAIKYYDRRDVRVNKLKVKEWDSYYISNHRYGLILKIADYSYIGLASITFIDFEKDSYVTKNIFTLLPSGKFKMPKRSTIGDCIFNYKNNKINFIKDGKKRFIRCSIPHFNGVVDFECDIEIYDEDDETIVTATSFNKKKHFLYSHKINCLRAKGEARIGGRRLFFSPQDSFASLDWNRGVLPHKNLWYHASLSSAINGKKIGFNFSNGLGSNTVTDNVLCYDGKLYKIDHIKFEIPLTEKGKEDFSKEWKITSKNGEVDLTFIPKINRHNYVNRMFCHEKNNQFFGDFVGVIKINNKEIKLNNLLGISEKTITRF